MLAHDFACHTQAIGGAESEIYPAHCGMPGLARAGPAFDACIMVSPGLRPGPRGIAPAWARAAPKRPCLCRCAMPYRRCQGGPMDSRSEEHTSELQSLMRTPYAVFCLKK